MFVLTWAYMQFPFPPSPLPSCPLPSALLLWRFGATPSFGERHFTSLDLAFLVSLLRAPWSIRHGASLNMGLMWSRGRPPRHCGSCCLSRTLPFSPLAIVVVPEVRRETNMTHWPERMTWGPSFQEQQACRRATRRDRLDLPGTVWSCFVSSRRCQTDSGPEFHS